jgi:L-ascorbate metabolism protein UlaG (beta-lactamase superfamily)
VVDGAVSAVGLKDVKVKDAIYLATQDGFAPKVEDGMLIDGPGEYEVKDVSIKGIPAERMIDHDKSQKATIYRIATSQVSVVVLGHVAIPLSEQQLEDIGVVDIVIVPIGGNGYTFDAHQAVETIGQIGPKVVIPTHYEDGATKYEVPQMSLEAFVKELGATEHVTVAKYKIKNGILPEVLTLVELTRS